MNHPFTDGNKRTGHAAMEAFLILNGCEIKSNVDDQEKLMIDLAMGNVTIEELTEWLKNHIDHITNR